jgi:hypothetical protein
MDMNEPHIQNNKIKRFVADITEPEAWREVLSYVDRNGKFDFCICTHTLEDIANPVFVCSQIQKIAKSGFVATPSKYREVCRFESGAPYRGYFNHRWIFDVEGTTIKGYPKVNMIDYIKEFDQIADLSEEKSELSFWWQDSVC